MKPLNLSIPVKLINRPDLFHSDLFNLRLIQLELSCICSEGDEWDMLAREHMDILSYFMCEGDPDGDTFYNVLCLLKVGEYEDAGDYLEERIQLREDAQSTNPEI